MANSRMSYAGATSATMKNRVNPTAKVTSSTKAPLQAVKPTNVTVGGSPQRISYGTNGLKLTPKGYPRSTFKGSAPANKPIKYGKGNVQMGSK